MDHDTHAAGTIPECVQCHESAYEPGWYAMLHRLSQRLEEAEETYFTPPPPPAPSYAIPEASAQAFSIPAAPVPNFA